MTTTRTITGAAYWASYIINGDSSGLEPEEIALCDKWQERELEPGESIVSCDDESRFSWHYGLLTGDDIAGGDVLDYTVLKMGE